MLNVQGVIFCLLTEMQLTSFIYIIPLHEPLIAFACLPMFFIHDSHEFSNSAQSVLQQ